MFFHFINGKIFHLNVFWVSSIIQINKLLFLLSLSLLFWLHDQQIYLQKREVFSEDNLIIIFTFYRKNNASTSFFTHFYSFNFIYTAYFVKNYFLFTSYMKYFYLWRVSIVTAVCYVMYTLYTKWNRRNQMYLCFGDTQLGCLVKFCFVLVHPGLQSSTWTNNLTTTIDYSKQTPSPGKQLFH